MKNEAFERAFSDLRLSGEARERILDAALEDGRKAPARRGFFRPLRAALAAALSFCLLTGVTLAASPELRERLWGSFGQVAQHYDETESAAQVYDGVEARISSALTDGYILKIHVEFRDTEGDRMREVYERRSYENLPFLDVDIGGPQGSAGSKAS